MRWIPAILIPALAATTLAAQVADDWSRPLRDPTILIQGPFPPPELLPIVIQRCDANAERLRVDRQRVIEIRSKKISDLAKITDGQLIQLRTMMSAPEYWGAIKDMMVEEPSCDAGAELIVLHPETAAGYRLPSFKSAPAAVRRILNQVDVLAEHNFGRDR